VANVLLGVTGSVAAVRVPALYGRLKERGHQVKIVATTAALYFFDPASIEPADPAKPTRNPEVVVLDEDEWPGRAAGGRYRVGDPVTHIELRRWADLFALAPLDANTLAKLANGLADNCLTCVWRAWDPARPVVLAPAMNTLMWEHPLTGRHLRRLAEDAAGGAVPLTPPPLPPGERGRGEGDDLDRLLEWINVNCPRLRVVPPQSKRLACGDVGIGALAEVDDVAAAVDDLLRHSR
jgi:phosphopantothenoylcysteine decarboxylase